MGDMQKTYHVAVFGPNNVIPGNEPDRRAESLRDQPPNGASGRQGIRIGVVVVDNQQPRKAAQ